MFGNLQSWLNILLYSISGGYKMADKTFNIEHYKVSLNHEITANWSGTTINVQGKVTCYGDEHRLIAYFLTDDSPLP